MLLPQIFQVSHRWRIWLWRANDPTWPSAGNDCRNNDGVFLRLVKVLAAPFRRLHSAYSGAGVHAISVACGPHR
jgi:hypothetical protein